MPRSRSIIRVDTPRMNALSWLINNIVPAKSFKNDSNHKTLLISKWLVGSSNNKISGAVTKAFANANLRNQPPERSQILSSGFKANVVITVSIRCSSCQALASSSCS